MAIATRALRLQHIFTYRQFKICTLSYVQGKKLGNIIIPTNV